jgi:glycosyltransferase involved in cell wall biosynthesis
MGKLTKKRILTVNDFSGLNTGYSIYGKELLTRLHNSGKYEVAEIACYCDTANPAIKDIPWKVYPNAVQANDPRQEQYKSNNINQFGLWRFNRCLADFRPHVVFDIRDYWMFAYQEASPYKKHFNWVIMPATDSAPPKNDWLFTFSNADVVIPYTEWAKQTLLKSCGNKINLFPQIANAGINPEEFYPIVDKKAHKIKHLGDDYNIIGTVMRNQKRKLIPDLVLAFKKYLEALKANNQIELCNKTYLYLHTSYPEDSGWDIPSILLEYGVLDKVLFTYHCRHCKKFFPSKFHNGLAMCKSCGNHTATVSSPVHGISTSDLNDIYNLFDLYIQYAICEGFGMPQVEAAACGVQIASVDYSAMSEVCESLKGIKIPVIRMFREMETNADRAYPDIGATTNIMYDFFVNTDQTIRLDNSIKIRQACISKYTWDHVYAVWDACFDSIDIKSKVAWDSPNVKQAEHASMKVPSGLNSKEFIEYICHNVINEPSLMNTAHIQVLIRDAVSGLVARNGSIMSLTKQNIVEALEGHLNNKIMCETMRIHPDSIKKEDFL